MTTANSGLEKKSSATKMGAVTFAILMRALLDEPMTYHDLVEKTGLSRKALIGYIRALYAQRVIRIAGWARTGLRGPWRPAWHVSPGKDVKPPVKVTNAERNRQSRARKKLASQLGLFVNKKTTEISDDAKFELGETID